MKQPWKPKDQAWVFTLWNGVTRVEIVKKTGGLWLCRKGTYRGRFSESSLHRTKPKGL